MFDYLRSYLSWYFLRKSISRIEVVVLDVDGVLTDGGLLYSPSGDVFKRFNVKDGLAIKLLQGIGIEVVLLSGGKGGATQARARDLSIKFCLVGERDKLLAIKKLSQLLDISPDKMLFVGDVFQLSPIAKDNP